MTNHEELEEQIREMILANKELADTVDQIEQWRSDPQYHLGDESRKRVIETILTDYKNKIKQKAKNRDMGKGFLLYFSVATALLSIMPYILEALGIKLW